MKAEVPISTKAKGRRVYITAAEFKKLFGEADAAEIKKVATEGIGELMAMPKRFIDALEAIAKSQAIVAEFFSGSRMINLFDPSGLKCGEVVYIDEQKRHDSKGQGNPDRAGGGPDREECVIPPWDPRRCAHPGSRYGWDLVKKQAICSYMCPGWISCPVPHKGPALDGPRETGEGENQGERPGA